MDLLNKYSKLIEELSKLKGVYGIYLFGSYVSGNIKPLSDIDVCFVVDEKDENLSIELLSEKNGKFDISLFHKLPLSIQFEVIKKGKLIKINNLEKIREQRLKYTHKYREESHILKKLIAKRYEVEA